MMIQGLVLGCALILASPNGPHDDLSIYETAKVAAGRDVEAQVRLALWCEARGLSALGRQHLRLAIEIKPDHPVARRLLGQMNDGGEWRTPDEASERTRGQADRAETLGRYGVRREQIADTPQAHWQMAFWCEQAGLSSEAEAHLLAVVRLDPTREDAWKKLGARKQGGRRVLPEDLASEKADAEARRKADSHWRPLLAKWKTWLGQKSHKAEAESSLEGLTDAGAIASIVKVFGAGGAEDQATTVRLLGQIDSPLATRVLASLAIFGSTDVVRRSAAETLAGRDPRECSPWLIALLRDPIKFEVKPVGGPGSPGELYVQGKRVNTRRFYSAPPPLLDLRPGDTLAYDENGSLIARRTVGYSMQSLAAVIDPQFQGAADLTGADAILGQTALGAYGERLGKEMIQNQKHAGAVGGEVMTMGRGASNSYRAPVQADIPYGQMVMQAEQQAAFARQQLEQDVTILKRYNAEVNQTNFKVLAALKVISGEARDSTQDAWKKWWVELEETSSAAPPRSRNFDLDEPKPTASTASTGAKARMPSFGKGTPVWTLAGLRPIEDLRIGDLVLTQDQTSGALSFAPVLTSRRIEPGMARTVRVGEASIVATDLERFWLAGRGWVLVGDLKPGDPIRTLGGLAKVDAIEGPKAVPVYHVQVGDRRGIFVGKVGLLARDDRVNHPVLVSFDAVPDLSANRAN